jgi:hypothetical protein
METTMVIIKKKAPPDQSASATVPNTEETTYSWKNAFERRSFLKQLGVASAIAALGPTSGFIPAAKAQSTSKLSDGDAAILRFLAAAEIIESDLWQQYNELGGVQDQEVPGGSGNKEYSESLEKIDDDMPQYIHDNTDDEFSHAAFINASHCPAVKQMEPKILAESLT